MMCAMYGVTRGGFYAWQARTPSARTLGDAELIEHVTRIHRDSRGFYGSPRIARKLRQQGVDVGRRRVGRLMRLARLQGRSARLYRRSRAGQHAFFTSIANSQRAVTLNATDQIWVADVTYLRVAGKWRYLAAVMDKHSRRIVGWSLSERRDVALTLQALHHAVRRRRPAPGCVFHTDRGIEYAAFEMRDALVRQGLVQSMNRPGMMNDNAHMESFFHSMKTEALYGLTFDTDNALRSELRSYIQFYNHERLHSALDYLPPVAFERREARQSCVN
jgi:transposase InsO family protein